MVVVNFADVSSERVSRLACPLVMIFGVLPVPPEVTPCANLPRVGITQGNLCPPGLRSDEFGVFRQDANNDISWLRIRTLRPGGA